MTVRLVVTEHPSHLTDARTRDYERIAARLRSVSGGDVATTHYLETTGFDGDAALVLSGSYAPWAAHDEGALGRLGEAVRAYDGPVLGICAGMQLQARFGGGTVAHVRERPAVGFREVEVLEEDGLLAGLGTRIRVYEHHTDEVADLPDGFRVLARSDACPVEAIAAPERRWWGTQFHPEEADEAHPDGDAVLRNFFALAGLGATAVA
jgi:GMP synthase (glutamine-hydrolysing)